MGSAAGSSRGRRHFLRPPPTLATRTPCFSSASAAGGGRLSSGKPGRHRRSPAATDQPSMLQTRQETSITLILSVKCAGRWDRDNLNSFINYAHDGEPEIYSIVAWFSICLLETADTWNKGATITCKCHAIPTLSVVDCCLAPWSVRKQS